MTCSLATELKRVAGRRARSCLACNWLEHAGRARIIFECIGSIGSTGSVGSWLARRPWRMRARHIREDCLIIFLHSSRRWTHAEAHTAHRSDSARARARDAHLPRWPGRSTLCTLVPVVHAGRGEGGRLGSRSLGWTMDDGQPRACDGDLANLVTHRVEAVQRECVL